MAAKIGLVLGLCLVIFACANCKREGNRGLGNRSLEEYKDTCKDWAQIRPQFNRQDVDVRELTNSEKNALFRCYDLDDNGSISLNEFLNFAFFLSGVGRPERPEVRNNVELYKSYDKNGDKKLSYDEFKPHPIWL